MKLKKYTELKSRKISPSKGVQARICFILVTALAWRWLAKKCDHLLAHSLDRARNKFDEVVVFTRHGRMVA